MGHAKPQGWGRGHAGTAGAPGLGKGGHDGTSGPPGPGKGGHHGTSGAPGPGKGGRDGISGAPGSVAGTQWHLHSREGDTMAPLQVGRGTRRAPYSPCAGEGEAVGPLEPQGWGPGGVGTPMAPPQPRGQWWGHDGTSAAGEGDATGQPQPQRLGWGHDGTSAAPDPGSGVTMRPPRPQGRGGTDTMGPGGGTCCDLRSLGAGERDPAAPPQPPRWG